MFIYLRKCEANTQSLADLLIYSIYNYTELKNVRIKLVYIGAELF